jgi:5-formyltetrahydrofolate cyclo-ligase
VTHDPAEAKAALRHTAMDRRIEAAASAGADAGVLIRDLALPVLDAGPGDAVSGFWPMRHEIDPRPLMEAVHAAGATCCLPVVERKAAPLGFRRWTPGDRLEPAAFGTREPHPDAPAVVPTHLLVPLLVFDREGYRLGYGGGFYDRTIAALRERAPVLTVGIAYAAQEIDAVPHDALDARLDWVVTEAEAIYIGSNPTTRTP